MPRETWQATVRVKKGLVRSFLRSKGRVDLHLDPPVGARKEDGSYLVTSNDAHVWVEVLFPGYG